MFGGFNVAKCDIQLQLCLGRIKIQCNKKQQQIRANKREVSELLSTNKHDNALIRVEGVLREKQMIQVYEILELYLELIKVRTQLLSKSKAVPNDMIEAVSSVVYASQRISDLDELAALRNMFSAKFGKTYVEQAASDLHTSRWEVNHKVIKGLLVEPPLLSEKVAELREIAREFNVEFDEAAFPQDIIPAAQHLPGHYLEQQQQQPPPQMYAATPAMMPAPGSGTQLPLPPAGQAQWAAATLQQQQHHFGSVQEASASAAQAAAYARAASEYVALMHRDSQTAQRATTPASPPPPQQSTTPPPHGYTPPGAVPGAAAGPSHPAIAVPPPKQRQTDPSSSHNDLDLSPPLHGHYSERSMEEVQRAYDAALGPPGKKPAHAGSDGPGQGEAAASAPPAGPSFNASRGGPDGAGFFDVEGAAPHSVVAGANGIPQQQQQQQVQQAQAPVQAPAAGTAAAAAAPRPARPRVG
ncbi:MAG: hypothetical protein WDW38_004012 [Sanguina aurantia]